VRGLEKGSVMDSEDPLLTRMLDLLGDLCRPIPEFASHFDRIGSHLVLNDVPDHRGFATTLASVVRPGARVVLAFNRPYASVVRGHVSDYFENGALGKYGGLAEHGIVLAFDAP
jgi:hypothetical protein